MYDISDFFVHNAENVEQGCYRIFEPDWKERVLQWFASEQVATDQKEALIERLIHFEDDCNDYFRYRAFFLAAEAIAVFKTSKQADFIVERLLRWSYDFCRIGKQHWEWPSETLTQAARDCLKRTDIDRVVRLLTQAVRTAPRLNTLRQAASYLGEIAPGNGCAIAILEHLAEHTQQTAYQRFLAVKSLAQVEPDNPKIAEYLLELLQTEITSSKIREPSSRQLIFSVLQQLKTVKTDKQRIIDFFAQLAEEPENIFFTGIHPTVELLTVIGADSEAAISTLVELIREIALFTTFPQYSTDDTSGWAVVIGLSKIAKHHQGAIAKVSSILSTAPDNGSLRLHAAAALLGIDPGNRAAVATLQTMLQAALHEKEQLTHLQETAAVIFTGVKLKQPLFFTGTVVDSCELRNRIASLKSFLWRISEALSTDNPNHQQANDTLLQLVPELVRAYPPIPTFSSLTRLDNPIQEKVRQVLLKLMTERPTQAFICPLIEEIESSYAQDPEIIAALNQLIYDDEHTSEAACTLARIIPGNDLAITTLTQIVQSESKYTDWQLWESACTLAQAKAASERTILALVHFSQCFTGFHAHSNIQRIAEPFRKIEFPKYSQAAISALKLYLHRANSPRKESLDPTYAAKMSSWQDVSGQRRELCNRIIWNCAQNMNYLDFHQAWHRPNTNRPNTPMPNPAEIS